MAEEHDGKTVLKTAIKLGRFTDNPLFGKRGLLDQNATALCRIYWWWGKLEPDIPCGANALKGWLCA